jgi:DNA gyrase subunit A
MAEQQQIPEDKNLGSISPRGIEQEMRESYLDYAMSVIVSRALPDVRDGLKPVARRILFAMHRIGLRSNARYRKSATVVGEVLGKYHPHGDTAVYDAMVRLAQDWSIRYPLIDGQGNFGSMDGDGAAAMRYTEAKMAPIASELLEDLEKETVDFRPNYDGQHKEPVVLPAKLPNLLLNGSVGIAVGMATNIPTHNLGEVVDATVTLLDNPDATVDELMEHVKGPDFPTGGIIYNAEEIRNAYATGKGKIVTRAVAEIEEGQRGDFRIVVTEIPYMVNKSSLIEKIADLHREKKIAGIADLRDESSDRDGVRIVIDLKKDAYPNKVLNQLFKMTQMQTAFHVNMLALVDGIQPRVLTLKMVLENYIAHRQEVVTRRTEFDLARAKAREHILEGLKIALDHIDEVIATIRASKTKEEAKVNLIKKFKLSDLQAQAILDMRLQALAGLERQRVEEELKEIKKLIGELEAILADPKRIISIIRTEILELRDKYADERRTKIIQRGLDSFSEEDLIPNEQVIVSLTRGNYIKRIKADTYRAQHRGGKGIVGMGVKEEDVVDHLVGAMNHDHILFFTNKGRVFHLKVHEVPQGSRTAKGQAVVNLIQIAPEEKVTAVITLPSFDMGEYLFMATVNGTVKKTKIKDYSVVRRSGLIAIKLDAGDELKWVKMTAGKDEIILASAGGQAVRFDETQVRPMGRATRGVRGIRLRSGDHVVGCDVAHDTDQLVVVMQNGFGKRTDIKLYAKHSRGGSGIKTAEVTKKTGRIVDMFVTDSLEGDLVIVTSQGQVIRTPLKSVSKLGRATQGVTLIRMATGDTVASVTLLRESEATQTVLTAGDTSALELDVDVNTDADAGADPEPEDVETAADDE